MRVIAGEFRSRKLHSMPGDDVRPTPDKMRQTLFNILQTQIEGTVFVDAYAGTGSVGIEALSRGARYAIFIEKNREAANLIKSNLSSLGIAGRARVIQGAAAIILAGPELAGLNPDFVFIDPPYPREFEYRAAMEALEANLPKLTIVQHATRFALKDAYGPLHRTRTVKQGENTLSFFTVLSDSPASES
jgi:16S rRNA (guanine966-N2)-methyltransferase